MSLARSFERHAQVITKLAATTPTPKPSKPAPLQRYGVQPPAAPKTTARPTSGAPATVTDTAGKTRWIQQLMPAQMAECKLAGLCFNCDEKYHHNHNCKQLCLVELAQDDDNKPVDADPEISLHALTDINTGRVMQLEVHVDTATLTALVDSGSTHNFVSKAAREKLGLAMQPTRTGMHVAMANEEILDSGGVACNLLINIQGETFIDCYSLPLSGFDFILGVR